MVELRELFDIQNGNSLSLLEMQIGSKIAFVSRGSDNNGIVAYVDKIDTSPFEPHKITVSLGGSVLESFYQNNKFYTAYHIKVLTPKFTMTKNQMLYYCMIIRSNNYRYSYGRQANKTLDFIKIPSLNEIPDYVNTITLQKPTNKSITNTSLELADRKWKYFYYDEIFEISGTKTTPIDELNLFGKGKFPYITTKAINNGTEDFFNYKTEIGNVLCIDSAVIGYCSYQSKDFSASDHVEKLKLKHYTLNKYIAMFLVTLCNLDQYRYSYGRKRSQDRIKIEKLKLPVDKNKNPDWIFMEDYIKSLPYSNNL